jgi:hypothetical protein
MSTNIHKRLNQSMKATGPLKTLKKVLGRFKIMRNPVWLLLFFPVIASAQLTLKDRLPPWAEERWPSAAGQLQIELSGRINPFLQRGDFDGDGRPDLAVLVQHKANRKIGILILHRNGKQTLLGAGKTFGNGGDDFEWMDLWWVEDRGVAQQSHNDRVGKLQGDGLVVAKEGSASALICFKAGRFHWQQEGD